MKRHLLVMSAATALVLAACGGGGAAVSVDDAWARATADGQTNGAVYFDLTVDDDDTLVAASVSSSVAAEAEVHEVVMDEMDEMSGEMGEMSGEMEMDASHEMDMGGAMVMRELADGLGLSGGETVTFEPGGYHVMLLGLAEPLEIGDEFDVTLEFAEADATTVTVEVAETTP